MSFPEGSPGELPGDDRIGEGLPIDRIGTAAGALQLFELDQSEGPRSYLDWAMGRLANDSEKEQATQLAERLSKKEE